MPPNAWVKFEFSILTINNFAGHLVLGDDQVFSDGLLFILVVVLITHFSRKADKFHSNFLPDQKFKIKSKTKPEFFC
jgi:hypothetical protein